ncbi:MAG: S9 family peptidase [Ideonella sp. MAG2]|nr:MAG: S9 family peptidase [Ideonella sp. MAG2]
MSILCLKRYVAAAFTCLMVGCAHQAPSATDSVLSPNPQLRAEGIPPIPMRLVQQVERYTDFRGHSFLDWHPQRREMLVSHRPAGASLPQLFKLDRPMGSLQPVLSTTEPISSASYEPATGQYIVFERSAGGSEVTQLFRLDDGASTPVQLSDPLQRHNFEIWLHPQRGQPSQLIHSSVPLDKTATGGSRTAVNTQLWLLNPLQPDQRRLLAELPGGGWGVSSASPDNRQVALSHYRSANESEVWLMDLSTGQRRQLLPAAGQAKAVHLASEFTQDGLSLWVVTDRSGEFRELQRLDLNTGTLTRMTAHIPWDVNGGSSSRDGRWLALRSNEDGLGTLRLFEGHSMKEVPLPALPNGSIGSTRFRPGSGELVFAVNGAGGPSQLFVLDAQTKALTPWTQAQAAAGIDASQFARQQIVRWPSFDGLTISGLLTTPPPKFSGKRPVLISIHGGPEGQATFGFLGRLSYLVEEMGVAIIQPNVRGSSGYGKTFLTLDNGFKREDSVKDIGALLDWIATQPQLDASRVLVMGGSYGGYMSLAVSTHYADRIAGAVDVVGISHFVTFLQNTESYRRDLRRVEYGDEREPAMRAHLEAISPLSNAHKIRKPLFVIQGRNDPRVPWTEAEQIVAKARANGTPVWYLLAENEGHGFQRKENADFQFYAMLLFMRETLKLTAP